MLGRVCIISIVGFILYTSASACTPCVGSCQNQAQYKNLVGLAHISNGTIGIGDSDYSLVGSAVYTSLTPAKVPSSTGLTPSQVIYIIQTTQTGYPLGSGTIIPYHPGWYLPSWWAQPVLMPLN